MMADEQQAARKVAGALGAYEGGLIGPSEMWHQIFETLTPESTYQVLDGLSESEQEKLRGFYGDLPYRLADHESTTAVYRRLIRWYQRDLLPEDVIWKAAMQHLRNVTSTRLLWEQILSSLTADNATASLSKVPRQVQLFLRAIYADEPLALTHSSEATELRYLLRDWCERGLAGVPRR
jgi:hypothetical protein